MKTFNFSHTFLLFILLIIVPLSSFSQFEKQVFNEDWEFYKGGLSYTQASDLSKKDNWKLVELPHDWSIEEPFEEKWASGTGYLPGGIAWYRKEFDLKKTKDKRYTIYFDGVYKNSEVWINGYYLGKRPNGFIPFYYDITDHIRNKQNLIIVKVDHSDYADSRFYTGSGIYRNVYLMTNEKHHFSQWGVFFTTPRVSSSAANVQVEVKLENHEAKAKPAKVRLFLKDKKGNIVTETEKDILSQPGTNNTQINFTVNSPKLWSVNHPELYILHLDLYIDNKIADQWENKVGIRDIRFNPDKGFFLNNESTIIKGVCIHHDAGALGAAVPEDVWKKRLETLKELGCNAIRMSHYPHQDYIYDLCDEMGFLVQDEAFDEWEIGKNKWIEGWNVGTPGHDGYNKDFNKWATVDLADMIKRNRNHPSIIMWSIGNEIDYPNDPYSHPVLDEGNNPQIYGKGYQKDNPPASRLGELAEVLVKSAKSVDTTRPVTAALAGVTMSNHTNYPGLLDIVGYNYQEYRYENDHKAFPDRIIYGSENGDALAAWEAVVKNEFISSQFLWTAFDFIGEARKWPSRSSGAGILDLAGKPKPDFYFRKSLWNDDPMVYLGVAENERSILRRFNISPVWDGKKGEKKWVTCYANTEEVELFLNGKSLGKQKAVYSTDKMISWEVEFELGELLAKGYNNGNTVAKYILNSPGKVSGLQVSTDKDSFGLTKREVIHIDILTVDSRNNRVINDDRNIEIEVKGPAKLIGLESGDLSSHENYQANHRKTYLGQLRAYIQTSSQKGDITVKIKSENLPENEIIIKSGKR
ncbi:glycoside hydrolase family 2 TIM barrel-domain containing protein [Abyssalbus ytuae]|uniref:DUF4982 domain-containing protein n=1 Tax=Abyssalbus ytuae TaxID=2926907 RepID=A0A9E7D243_9FLAO|nr:glycoside hydrolase family 2 TIM barrel-domain containing protein [Abyssalbus ytuae]UOB17768.1 DUF4982 domain-containing protein [Abyssalbus ytuae]